ncbi:hypothetical protein [Lacinutrix sp. Hel_I_90]|uniref:hypothetical protein n=1 Tax=Lacinutrix sp. Hel_I_90 TaxID=1249999 RepID=UPI0005CAD693|nr:hypothetical protein [Lacinutrix sp. Hel_I_90]
MTDNTRNLIQEIKAIATSIIEKDITTVRGFSERQIEAIAKQTELIQIGVLSGDIDEDLLDFFLEGLEAMVQNFINTLKGLLLVTLEKLWNSIIVLLYEAIGIDIE